MTKTALITGITGQDGAYLSRHLLGLGYRVVGGVRRTSTANTRRLEELDVAKHVELVDLDLFELGNVLRAFDTVKPDEIYNLAAQSFVAVSFEQPLYTSEIDALGVTRLLETIRLSGRSVRFYQASTSEMFGKAEITPQRETTPFHPRSPYGVAKLYAHWMTVNYRESWNLHASSGILFNHESPLRGLEFVTRKITHQLAQIKRSKRDCLHLGNLYAKRDWGYAADFVRGMHLMLQQNDGSDFVLATGETNTVKSFVALAAQAMEIDLEWQGAGIDEKGIDRKTGRAIVAVDPKFFRPAEVDLLIGSPDRARKILGWEPKTTFKDLVMMMAEADLKRVSNGEI